MIVIDIGCAKYGGDYSIERLIEEFHPDELYGFDPNATTAVTYAAPNVHIHASAAWTYDGQIGFEGKGLGGRITAVPSAEKVPCFDLARFIVELDQNDIVLKIDAEGAEYELLEHLIERRADALLRLAWVEWHPPGQRVNGLPDKRREAIEERIACEMHQWNW